MYQLVGFLLAVNESCCTRKQLEFIVNYSNKSESKHDRTDYSTSFQINNTSDTDANSCQQGRGIEPVPFLYHIMMISFLQNYGFF